MECMSLFLKNKKGALDNMRDYEKIARKYGIPEKDIADFTWLCRSLDIYTKALATAKKHNKEKTNEYKREINNLKEKLKKYNKRKYSTTK